MGGGLIIAGSLSERHQAKRRRDEDAAVRRQAFPLIQKLLPVSLCRFLASSLRKQTIRQIQMSHSHFFAS